ncbi:MAG: hypothetical protein ACREQA_01950 [Candidatus Binatia bacterium]
MRRVKKYFDALALVFIGSGVLAGLLWAMRAGFWSGLQFGFLFAISLTVFFGLLFLPLDYFFTKNSSNSELDLKQNEELRVRGNLGDVFQRSVEILSSLETIKSVQPQRDQMIIVARTKASLFSFGEEIRLRFIPVEREVVKIEISSEPVFVFTKIDYGKNLKNVRSIGKTITETLKTSVGGRELG